MSTKRRRYHIDVTWGPKAKTGWYTLKRTNEQALPWWWCPHYVRATSNASAHRKALAEHQRTETCQALDQEVRTVIIENGLM